jgi:hypothetical protein
MFKLLNIYYSGKPSLFVHTWLRKYASSDDMGSHIRQLENTKESKSKGVALGQNSINFKQVRKTVRLQQAREAWGSWGDELTSKVTSLVT